MAPRTDARADVEFIDSALVQCIPFGEHPCHGLQQAQDESAARLSGPEKQAAAKRN